MKRPSTQAGRIRYYGLMMAELTADLMQKRIHVSYTISARYVSLHFWESLDDDNAKITHTGTVWFDYSDNELDEFDQFIEATVAELTGQEAQL